MNRTGFLDVERTGVEVRRRIRRLSDLRDAAYLRYRESDSAADKERFMRYAAQVDILAKHSDIGPTVTIRNVSQRVVDSFTNRASGWSQ